MTDDRETDERVKVGLSTLDATLTPEQSIAIIAAVGRIAHASPGAPETPITALEPRPNRDWAEEKTLADFRRVFADERKWKSLGFGRTEG